MSPDKSYETVKETAVEKNVRYVQNMLYVCYF